MKVTTTDIQNSFGKYLRLCATEPVYITKNGVTIAKLLNHTSEDEIIEESPNLRRVFEVDQKMRRDYPYEQVAEAMEAYDLSRIQMTYEEFQAMNEDATNRYEYIDGEVYLLSSPNVYHQRIIARFHIALDHYLKGKPCDAFESPFDVTLLRKANPKFTNIVQPDLLVACNWQEHLNDKGRYTGIPKLVVEVLSPSNITKEMFTKLDLYRDSGIEEYWIIDELRGMTIVYRFEEYNITQTKTFRAHEVCESFVFPGLRFAVKEDISED